jgi:hypothetical protein
MPLETLIWPSGVEGLRRYIDSESFHRYSKLAVMSDKPGFWRDTSRDTL